jgi:pteridine reductase
MPGNGKIALVTGSGKRRVGRSVAEALAGRGYALMLHYHTAAAEAQEAVDTFRAKGVEAAAQQADLSDEQTVRRLIQATVERFGRIDVLVNCAAVWPRRRLEEVTAADIRRCFDANVLGTFLCAREAGLVMAGQPMGGCIVNLGDWAQARPYLDYSAYFATKGAIPTLTRCLAVELGTRNPRVRVNCILPGPVMIPADLPEAERQAAVEATLVKREGRPGNIAQAVRSHGLRGGELIEPGKGDGFWSARLPVGCLVYDPRIGKSPMAFSTLVADSTVFSSHWMDA